MSPLSDLQLVRATDGSSLPLGLQLYRLSKPQVLHFTADLLSGLVAPSGCMGTLSFFFLFAIGAKRVWEDGCWMSGAIDGPSINCIILYLNLAVYPCTIPPNRSIATSTLVLAESHSHSSQAAVGRVI